MAGGKSVFLFIPNIIGYGRIILLLYSCWYMRISCWHTVLAYILSGFLDAVDGHAARALNQSSRFGAMLDMLVDRCATMCLLTCLTTFYPKHTFLFQMSMMVDIASHWLHVHSSTAGGGKTHKVVDLSGNSVLRIYYHNKIVLFLMCMGNEMFYSLLYMLHFMPGPIIVGQGLFSVLAYLTAPVAFVKFLINVVQLYAAAVNLVAIDEQEMQTTKDH